MALKHVILGVLLDGACTGYDITKKFDDVLGYFWKASHQQIYRELAKLSSQKFVVYSEIKQTNKPNKKIYTITEQGQHALLAWISAPTEIKIKNDEVLVKLYVAHHADPDKKKKILLDAQQQHQKQYNHYKVLEKYCFDGSSQGGDMDKLVHMTLKKGLLLEKARLDWCTECLHEVE